MRIFWRSKLFFISFYFFTFPYIPYSEVIRKLGLLKRMPIIQVLEKKRYILIVVAILLQCYTKADISFRWLHAFLCLFITHIYVHMAEILIFLVIHTYYTLKSNVDIVRHVSVLKPRAGVTVQTCMRGRLFFFLFSQNEKWFYIT